MKKMTVFLLLAFALPLAAHFLQRREPPMPEVKILPLVSNDTALIIVRAAELQTYYTHSYDPSYKRLAYPGGDVPSDRGVCSDVVVRAFRATGIDLQKDVHEDMRRSFSAYPNNWGLSRPDPNIDHRRVANLMTFFERRGCALGITRDPGRFLPGDVVAWRLDNGRLHIGIVDSAATERRTRYLVLHNIGDGVQREDILFRWEIIGHYRYYRGRTNDMPR